MRRFIAGLFVAALVLSSVSAFAGPSEKWCYHVSLSVRGRIVIHDTPVCVPCPPSGCPSLPVLRGGDDDAR